MSALIKIAHGSGRKSSQYGNMKTKSGSCHAVNLLKFDSLVPGVEDETHLIAQKEFPSAKF